MLDLRSGQPVEILKTVATTGEGIDELVQAIDRHRVKQDGSRRAKSRAAAQLLELVKDRLLVAARSALDARGGLDALAEEIAERRRDPYAIADEVVAAAKLV